MNEYSPPQASIDSGLPSKRPDRTTQNRVAAIACWLMSVGGFGCLGLVLVDSLATHARDTRQPWTTFWFVAMLLVVSPLMFSAGRLFWNQRRGLGLVVLVSVLVIGAVIGRQLSRVERQDMEQRFRRLHPALPITPSLDRKGQA